MQIAEAGEFALIDRIAQIIGTQRPDVVVGIGDDVAVLEIQGENLLIATVDNQVETIHFLSHLTTAHQLGQRALAVNVSDIAAVGGRPLFALVSLALPPATEIGWVEELYRGLRAAAERMDVAIVGGNMTRSTGGISVDVTLLGSVARDRLLLRSGARPGDRVLVTSQLGDAGAGLRAALQPELPIDPALRAPLIERYLTPTPRLRESAVLAQLGVVTAMIDLSDGLESDIGHICDRSAVGIRLWAERLPVSMGARRVAELSAVPISQIALSDGDDYELCFTVPTSEVAGVCAAVQQATGTSVTEVGQILPQADGRWLVLPDGQEVPLKRSGWEHFTQP